MDPFRIKIEVFGIPRLRAGVAEFFVDVCRVKNRLADIRETLNRELPAFGDACVEEGQLRKDYVFNISGKRFTRSADYEILPEDTLLILSSDAGG